MAVATETSGQIKIIDLQEFYYSHGELAKHKNRADSIKGNDTCFINDLFSGVLDRYRGTSVIYQKGIMCGQSKDGRDLYEKASAYYGSSSLSVYGVPIKKEDDTALEATLFDLYIGSKI